MQQGRHQHTWVSASVAIEALVASRDSRKATRSCFASPGATSQKPMRPALRTPACSCNLPPSTRNLCENRDSLGETVDLG